MSNLRNLNNLISEIYHKLIQYQKGDNKVNKKEVEDFIYFLIKSN